jgi:hypothetical protein
MKTNKQMIKESHELYQKHGSDAVYRYAVAENVKAWDVCHPCEETTPTIDGICLVCWTSKQPH